MSEILSVSELNILLKDELKKIFQQKISVKGELSGYKKYNNTIYANLKDDVSSISIIKFRCENDNLTNGDLVQITGNIDYYIKNGNINFLCNKIINTGIGNIQKQLEDLKQKYQNLGYFLNKKSFPNNIKSIGIITAKDGAALQDILFVLNSNKFDGQIYIKNSPVQGNDCPKGLCSGIRFFNKFLDKINKPVDIIMITRGGGGIDDLMGFSHPDVIEEIFKSKIFTISAVGHEVDNMLSDFVSDIRAPTPSIGAEIICKNVFNRDEYVKKCKEKLINSKQLIQNRLNLTKRNFCSIKKKMYLNQYELNKQKIILLDKIYIELINKKFDLIKNDINLIKSNISILKHNEYNVILLKNNNLIRNIDDISNGIYDIKINSKIKKIKISLILSE
jgi:exodeoxyribonuclease VII large subunit